MNGNYRHHSHHHHYLMTAATHQATPQQMEQQANQNHEDHHLNGLPQTGSQVDQLADQEQRQLHLQQSAKTTATEPSSRHMQQQQTQIPSSFAAKLSRQFDGLMSNLTGNQQARRLTVGHKQQQQQQVAGRHTIGLPGMDASGKSQQQVPPVPSRPARHQQINYLNNNNNHLSEPTKQQQYYSSNQQQDIRRGRGASVTDQQLAADFETHQDQYASQLRSRTNDHFSQMQREHQKQQQVAPKYQAPNISNKPSSSSSNPDSNQSNSSPAPITALRPTSGSTSGQQGESNSPRPLHVNFNRGGGCGNGQAAADDDEEEGDSRKKKYLTAKYGQQQMNLIKKRLKIEMWLHERLQELAKGSKSEDELDEIDIDLDQLLDMDNDDTRRHWLMKTLAPFEDVPGERMDKFISEVLEQSKLL